MRKNCRTVTYMSKTYEVEYMSAKEAAIRGNEASMSFQETPLLRRIAKMGLDGTYLDIGANIGNHSIFFNWHTKADRVIAFEPHPITRRVLIRNLLQNGCTRVEPSHFAFWDKPCKLHMDDLPCLNAGRAQIVELGGKFAKKKKHEVEATSLDVICRPKHKVSLIKMDVEDSEERVIKGGLEFLARERPVIVAEHHDNNYLQRCCDLLRPLGYKLDPELFEPRGETRLWIPDHPF
jgi:FkbM family methyltransferase